MSNTLFTTKATLRTTNARHVWNLYLIVSCVISALIPLLLVQYDYSVLQTFLGVVLISVCSYPTVRYVVQGVRGAVAMPAICIAYALQFAVPVFTAEPKIDLAGGVASFIAGDDVIAALLLSILGVCLFQIGYYRVFTKRIINSIPTIRLHLDEHKALIFCVVMGVVFPLTFSVQAIVPEAYQVQLSSITGLLQNQVLVVIGVLGWLVYTGRGGRLHKFLLYAIVGFAAVRGIATGFIEQAIVPIGVLVMTKWLYTKQIPLSISILTIGAILFLAPVKGEFRQQAWFGDASNGASQSPVSKVVLWTDQAINYWSDTLTGTRQVSEATNSATSRLDLIHQFAYIYSLTPSAIPYQYGKTYSYLLIAFVPRVLWPDKPQAGAANKYYAVTYDITTEEGAEKSSFGMSFLGESYINFGVFGIIGIMLIQGVIVGLLQRVFGDAQSGAGGQAVFLASTVYLLNGIGSSTEILFGNLLQNLICSCLLLWWARENASKKVGVQMKQTYLAPSR